MWTKVQLNWGTAGRVVRIAAGGRLPHCTPSTGLRTRTPRPHCPHFRHHHPTDRPVTTNFPSKRTFAHLHTQAASLLTQSRTLLFVQIWQRNSLSFHWTFWRDFSFWGHSGLEPKGAVRSHARCEQGLTSTRYPTWPELFFCYPNPTRTIFQNFQVEGFSQQAVSQKAASNLWTIILKFCCFLVVLTLNPLLVK